eukprot:9990621-Alexandrium_andersonii.AAC.1
MKTNQSKALQPGQPQSLNGYNDLNGAPAIPESLFEASGLVSRYPVGTLSQLHLACTRTTRSATGQ